MSLAPFRTRTQLPGRFREDELTTLYTDTYTALADSFRSNPALGVMHHMMAERLAYIYVKSIEAGRDETNEDHVERSFLDAFNRLASELGKETRVQAREGVVKQALVAGIIMVLREELDGYPELVRRINSRLEEL